MWAEEVRSAAAIDPALLDGLLAEVPPLWRTWTSGGRRASGQPRERETSDGFNECVAFFWGDPVNSAERATHSPSRAEALRDKLHWGACGGMRTLACGSSSIWAPSCGELGTLPVL